jgi:tRNA dimethylallyltransferase
VGKTGLILELKNLNIEVINADSMQVYKYMDIGTCKPDINILKNVPHHLINIVKPDEQFNTGEFVREADKLVRSIAKRGNIPVLCGGTAFYFKNFIFGMPEVPKSRDDIREAVAKKLQKSGLYSLYLELQKIDREYADKISSNDKLRILRALEVYEQTGKPVSFYKVPEKQRKEYIFLLIGLKRKRSRLYERIEQRVDILFKNGLPFEVKKLIEMGYNASDPGMKAIGYKEFLRKGSNSLQEIKNQIKKNSKAYAKRQMTFFNSFDNVLWFHPDDINDIKNTIKDFINS